MCCFKKPGNEPKKVSKGDNNKDDIDVPKFPQQMTNNNFENKNNVQSIELNQQQRKSESRPDVLATRSRVISNTQNIFCGRRRRPFLGTIKLRDSDQ